MSYRYTLRRDFVTGNAEHPRCLWVMCNPSTADDAVDDQTIRKVVGFTKRFTTRRYVGLDVVNLYALRATDPRRLGLPCVGGPVGEKNDAVIEDAMHRAEMVVFAWGAAVERGPNWRARVDTVVAMAHRTRIQPMCLGLTQGRWPHPRHPVMLGYATRLERYSIWQDDVIPPPRAA